jgi:hypothetical protein
MAVRRFLLLVAIVLVALPGAALAQAPAGAPPSLTDDFSAADQYVEAVPTAGGPKAPGVGANPNKRSNKRSGSDAPPPLSKSVESSLQRQPEETAAVLEQIATSPDYGAPTEKLKKRATPRIPTAAVSAVGEGEQDTLTWLLLALLAITGLAAGTTAYRRYQAKKSTN